MKTDLSGRFLVRAAIVALVTIGSSGFAWSQEKRPLGPEVVAILGEPDGAKGDLDVDVVAILGKPDGAKPLDSAVDARSADIASKLRCPVCQGVSIADSPSGMATKMRGQVKDLVARGYSEEQVVSYFERSYGEFVRLEPPMRGLNFLLWILPAMVLLGGALLVFLKARQPARVMATSTQGAAPPEKPVDPELAKYLDRVRRDSGTAS